MTERQRNEERGDTPAPANASGLDEAVGAGLFPELWAVARLRLGRAADADDAVAATFERALSVAPPHRDADLRGWLFGILGNVCFEALRGRLGLPQVRIGTRERDGTPSVHELLTRSAGASRALRLQELAREFGRALLALDPAGREVFVYRELEGLDVAEVARRLGITPSHVGTLLHRAKVRLRELLDEDLVRDLVALRPPGP